MHIKGTGLPTQEIELYLKPIDTRYILKMGPSEFPPISLSDPYATRAIIRFEDIHEIQTLINILIEFRDSNFRYFGEWKTARKTIAK